MYNISYNIYTITLLMVGWDLEVFSVTALKESLGLHYLWVSGHGNH